MHRIIGVKEALARAYKANIPVITGVSNTGQFDVTLFAEDWQTISVAACNVFDEVSDANSFSYSYEVFAPGGCRKRIENSRDLALLFPKDVYVRPYVADYDDPLVAIGSDGYSFLTLGSAAMPHVAGAVAMIKSYLPDSSVLDVRELLKRSTVPLKPSGSLLEGLGGRVSLPLLRRNIDDYIQP